MPLASARQHPENQKENQAGHSSERTVESQGGLGSWLAGHCPCVLGFGLDGCLLLAGRGRVYVQFTTISIANGAPGGGPYSSAIAARYLRIYIRVPGVSRASARGAKTPAGVVF